MDSSKNVSGHWTHSFNPQWLNDLSFGYVHTTSLRGAPDMLANRNLAPDFGIKNTTTEPDCYAPPGTDITGFGNMGAWGPSGAIDVNHQIVDQLAYSSGRHSVKIGTDLRWLAYNDDPNYMQAGPQSDGLRQ